MILAELVLGSTAYAGIRFYRKRRQKQRISHFLQPPLTPHSTSLSLVEKAQTICHEAKVVFTEKVEAVYATAGSALTVAKEQALQLKPGKMARRWDGTRQNQLSEVSSADEQYEKMIAEKKANRDLAISTFSLGMAAGGLIFPPLGFLSLPGFIYGNIPIFKEAQNSLFKERKVNVDVLHSILSSICLIQGYYFAGNLCVWVSSLRLKLLTKIKDNAKRSLFDVYKLQPRFTSILSDGVEIQIPSEVVQIGHIAVVHAGESIPADGVITEGIASIDQHILTGESQPAEKRIGDPVFASTVVLMGKICFEVKGQAEETTVAKIASALNEAANSKTTLQLQAEAVSDRITLPTLVASALCLPFLGPMGTLVILNAHFGYRLTVVGAMSLLNYLRLASHRGILVKDGRAIDTLAQVDTVVFDKTGTLTQEQPHIGQIYTCDRYEANELLRYAAAVEYKQTHPIAKAILQEANRRDLNLPKIDDANYEVGYGLMATINGQFIRVGSSRFMTMEGITIPQQIKETQKFCHQQGHSLVMAAINDKLLGAIEMHATVRPEAKTIINRLQRHTESLYIISGDHETPTKKLAQELGIHHYFAETLPQNKAELIKQWQTEGRIVCYVGDGINDAIALETADVSVSLRGASTMAIDTAQIVLMDESLNHLGQLFDWGRDFDANMKIGFLAILGSSIVSISGAFLWHFGLVHSIIVQNMGFVAGMWNAMLPLMKQQNEE